jgi:uncharacterized protein with GYD domain
VSAVAGRYFKSQVDSINQPTKRMLRLLQLFVESIKQNIMATYISLVQFTDKGIHAAKETTRRVTEWAAKVQSLGVTIKQMYWTLGQYDQVCVFEAPNDETAASVLLSADILGNIRTQTLRAFTSVEMEKILANIP